MRVRLDATDFSILWNVPERDLLCILVAPLAFGDVCLGAPVDAFLPVLPAALVAIDYVGIGM